MKSPGSIPPRNARAWPSRGSSAQLQGIHMKGLLFIAYWIAVVGVEAYRHRRHLGSISSFFHVLLICCHLSRSPSAGILQNVVSSVSTPGRDYIMMVPVLKRIVILGPDPDTPYQSLSINKGVVSSSADSGLTGINTQELFMSNTRPSYRQLSLLKADPCEFFVFAEASCSWRLVAALAIWQIICMA